jgi:hypothetical protein
MLRIAKATYEDLTVRFTSLVFDLSTLQLEEVNAKYHGMLRRVGDTCGQGHCILAVRAREISAIVCSVPRYRYIIPGRPVGAMSILFEFLFAKLSIRLLTILFANP